MGLPLGFSVKHSGAWEAWTLGQSGMVRMIIMEGWSGCAADHTLHTRGIFDVSYLQGILKPRAVIECRSPGMREFICKPPTLFPSCSSCQLLTLAGLEFQDLQEAENVYAPWREEVKATRVEKTGWWTG